MEQTRQFAPNTVRRVMSLYEEGWHVPNIASIARLRPDTVKQVLLMKNVEVEKLMQ